MNLVVSSAPHIRSPRTTKHIMLDVLIALLPATVAGIVFFGWAAAVTVLLSVFSAALTEFVWYIVEHKIWRNGKETLRGFVKGFDFTSLVTGLLLALCLPASPDALYMPVLGAIFAVAVSFVENDLRFCAVLRRNKLPFHVFHNAIVASPVNHVNKIYNLLLIYPKNIQNGHLYATLARFAY